MTFVYPEGRENEGGWPPKKKQKRKRNNAPKKNGFKNEDEFQIWAMKVARTLYPAYPIWHTPNETAAGNRQKDCYGRTFNNTGNLRKAKGVIPGVCDVIDIVHRLAIELKMPGNKPTANQTRFMKAMRKANGWTVGIAYDKDEYMQLYSMATGEPVEKLWEYYGLQKAIVALEPSEGLGF